MSHSFISKILFRRRPAQKAEYGVKKGEGLKFTAKGSKDLAGGRRLHLIVAIAYGKGVVLKEAYEKMDSRFFAQ